MLRVGYEPGFGGLIELRLSTLANESYSAVPYERAYDGTLRYTRPLGAFSVGGEVFTGRDVFGESFTRVGAFFSYTGDERRGLARTFSNDGALDTSTDKSAEVFVDAGLSANQVHSELQPKVFNSANNVGAHLAIGARRAVSD